MDVVGLDRLGRRQLELGGGECRSSSSPSSFGSALKFSREG
jgi:hypothetical protein